MKSIPAIIMLPLVVHVGWAAIMLTSPVPIHTMGIDAVYKWSVSNTSAQVVMVLTSVAAFLSHAERWHGKLPGLALVLPQQFLMLWGLWTIVSCLFGISDGDGVPRYANGYAPPEGWRFIAADQFMFAVASILHTAKIIQTYFPRR